MFLDLENCPSGTSIRSSPMVMRLLLGAVLGVACGFLSVLGRPPRSARQGRGGWDGEPAPEPDLNPNRWTSQPYTWGADTWSGAENYGNHHQDAPTNHGGQATYTGNLGAGQWDDSYGWQQPQWWDAPGSWVQTGWTAGYWDGYAWNTPSWTASSASSSSTRWGERSGQGWPVPSPETNDGSQREQSQPPGMILVPMILANEMNVILAMYDVMEVNYVTADGYAPRRKGPSGSTGLGVCAKAEGRL